MKINDIQFNFKSFSGAMDLLLNLLEKNKIDIYDIPISLILEQYLEAIKKLNPEIYDIAEFLEIVSELSKIKSKMLIPTNDTDLSDYTDPREELVSRLIEYKKIKELSKFLIKRYDVFSKRIFRNFPFDFKYYKKIVEDEHILYQNEFENENLNYFDNLPQLKIIENDKLKIKYEQIIKNIDLQNNFDSLKYLKYDYINLNERINLLNKKFFNKKKLNKGFTFNEIINNCDKYNIIINFLAILEIIKSNNFLVYEEKGEIFFKNE